MDLQMAASFKPNKTLWGDNEIQDDDCPLPQGFIVIGGSIKVFFILGCMTFLDLQSWKKYIRTLCDRIWH